MNTYRPKVVRQTTQNVLSSMGTNDSGALKASSGLQYRVKTNIFGGNTFAILSDSFVVPCGETLDFVEGLHRRIIENGGKVVG